MDKTLKIVCVVIAALIGLKIVMILFGVLAWTLGLLYYVAVLAGFCALGYVIYTKVLAAPGPPPIPPAAADDEPSRLPPQS